MNAGWLEAVDTVGGRRPRALVAGAFVKSLWLCESEMHCDTSLAILHRVPRPACRPHQQLLTSRRITHVDPDAKDHLSAGFP